METTEFWKPLRRRVVAGRVEIYVKCPVMCHGFGVCSTCHDKGGYWRRPKPHYVPYGSY